MKKKIIIALAAVVFLLAFCWFFLKINSYNLSNRIPDVPVYVPDGISDDYEDAKSDYLNEWQEIWMFELSDNEADEIGAELSNGNWMILSDSECKYINEAYFSNIKFNCNKSDEMFYCLYDCRTDKFVELDVLNTLLYSERQILFAYNKTLSDYYCVYIGM